VRLRVFNKYAEDEANTRTQTVMLMLIGGGKIAGVHGAHVGPGIHIRYAAPDGARQTIPWVEYRDENSGKTLTFAASDSTPDSIKAVPKHDMQCVDCHNRPTHRFELPDRAMDEAMALGEIPVTLPYIKKKGLEALKENYPSSKEANEQLPASIISFYQKNYPDVYGKRSQDITQAAQAILAIYNRNVFPDMKVTWGTYPNNLGHTDFPGCFRCHDGSHMTGDGKSITQDCNACHEPLAMEETSPEILKSLGIAERISSVQKQ
jgi:hypothetical protein